MQRGKVREVQVVVKWGGELTVGGLQRAESLGQTLRYLVKLPVPKSATNWIQRKAEVEKFDFYVVYVLLCIVRIVFVFGRG